MATKSNPHLYVVILCGGGGTRLWPLSRAATPKQFIELLGEETLFEKTLKRAESLVDHNHLFIITNEQYLSDVQKYTPHLPSTQIIAEPQKKNTALAMGVVAGIIHTLDPEAIIINLASDHLVGNLVEFQRTVLAAATAAHSTKSIVSIGIKPTFPHPGLGYIHRGSKVTDTLGFPVYQVAGFREKPSIKVASEYLATGEYYWNANLYTWTTQVILAEFQSHAPMIFKHIKTIMSAFGSSDFAPTMQAEYAKCPEDQIDTAISEKTDHLVVIPGDFGWTDIGSWNVVHDESVKDADGNALVAREEGAEWMRLNTSNSLVSTARRLVVTIGVDNLLIIDTPDALLITPKPLAQEVKKVVVRLKQDERNDLI